jgi:hypothetical protein
MRQRLLLRPVFLLLVPIIISGCGLWSITPYKSDIERAKKGRITAITYTPSPFTAEYPGFEQQRFTKGNPHGFDSAEWKPLLEFNALVSAGNALIRGFGLVDPAITVRYGVAAYLERDLGFERIIMEKEPQKDDAIKALRKRFGSTGVVLDFTTISWEISHFQRDIDHYRLYFKVRGRLIDLGASKVLWRASCSYTSSKDPAESPTFLDLTADRGEWLRRMLAEGAGQCAGEFNKRFKELE